MKNKVKVNANALKKQRFTKAASASVNTGKQLPVPTKPGRPFNGIDQQLIQLKERAYARDKRSKSQKKQVVAPVVLAPSILSQMKEESAVVGEDDEFPNDASFVPFVDAQQSNNPRVENIFSVLDVDGDNERYKVHLRPASLQVKR